MARKILNFTGTHWAEVAEGRRIVLPAAFRKQAQGVAFCLVLKDDDEFGPCLALYPKEDFQSAAGPITESNAHMASTLNDLKVDGKGRFVIPFDIAGVLDIRVKSTVGLFGCVNRIEIRKKETALKAAIAYAGSVTGKLDKLSAEF